MENPIQSLPLREGTPFTMRDGSPDPSPANGFINILSQPMKSLVKKVQDLRHLGIENSTLPLPKIVVVGDQSTGKSSLIEGISEIQVPRSAGCCTRCPLEINLTESDGPWTCRVLLMKKYVYALNVPKKKAPTTKNPFGPWIEHEQEELLFDTVTEKSELPTVLKWAQLATLNPGRSYKDYIPGENADTDPTAEVKFSPNVVRLDISAPGFPNLSFYDLPGVINVAEVEEEKYLVGLVENLVKAYIKAENTIVLLTMPMTDDATNSSAARIIREVPGARNRTLGVLTKPDRIDSGYEQWDELLSGQKFVLGYNYYVVKNNSDPSVDHAQAREEEHYFFTHPPWAADFAEYSERFGTKNLLSAISTLLLNLIKDSLPQIVDRINIRVQIVQAELAKLPAPPTANIPYVVCQLLNVLTNNIEAHMNGGSSNHLFLKDWDKLALEFQACLADSKPVFRISENLEVRKPPQITLADDDEDFDMMDYSPKRKLANGTEPEPNKRMKIDPSGTGRPSRPAEPQARMSDQIPDQVRSFTPMDIRNISMQTYSANLPGLTNPQAVETVNRISVDHWKASMDNFLSATYVALTNVLMSEVEKVFGPYEKTALFGALRAIILQFIDSIKNEHSKQAMDNFQIEKMKPFTRASLEFFKKKEEALSIFTDKRFALRWRLYRHQYKEINDRKAPDSAKSDIGPDEFSKEIEIMAASRAYYDIASIRFVDVTCQGMFTKLFFRCRDEMREAIEKGLGILDNNAAERCVQLMVEDEDRQRRRNVLLKELDKLERAQARLRVEEIDANAMEPKWKPFGS